MSQSFHLSLRAGEKIYLNGAVLRADRKVTLELLNDVTFLLESHVLQADEATTPLRQLYFVVQTMLMEPDEMDAKLELFREFHKAQLNTFESPEIVTELDEVGRLVESKKHFEALRTIRRMFALESEIMSPPAPQPETGAVPVIERSIKDGSYAA
ncbi:MAG: flagellar biosynthesis repressor FlbT [Rhizobiales bacterium]|nr:flagellar biosynthesis repressor FlbT [Hyphomicrobiales bacterium]